MPDPLLRSCLQLAGFCLVQGSKVLYSVCKQVEHLSLLSQLLLTEDDYRTMNFGCVRVKTQKEEEQ